MKESIKLMEKEHQGKKIWTLFIDLKSAFDKVDHKILIKRLENMNINPELINTIKWLYGTTKIQVNDKEINIGRGVI